MSKLFIQLSAISGFITVALGAFGAHGLKNLLEKNEKLAVFETAVKYQMFHTIALFAIALLLFKFENKQLVWAGYSYLVGILIFSGSLYILAITNYSKLGMITPIGGLFFLAGWVLLFIGISNQ